MRLTATSYVRSGCNLVLRSAHAEALRLGKRLLQRRGDGRIDAPTEEFCCYLMQLI